MRNLMAALVLVVSVAGLAYAAGDPWKAKPFTQWDEKDIRRILTDSPWSKPVQVPAPWTGGGDTGGSAGATLPSAAMDHTPDGGIMGQRGTGAAPSVPQVPQATFIVRWVSSRVVREAVLRSAVLDGRMKQEDAEKQAAQQMEFFQVLIAGQDMKPFEKAEEKALVAKTYLLTKKTKQRISAVGVEYSRGQDGKSVIAIAFAFPKKTANEEATLASDEKGVEFYCSVAGANIRATFEIPKMEDGQGRDL